MLGQFVIAPFLIALIFPIFYTLRHKRKNLRDILFISLCSILVVIGYPIVSYLSMAIPLLGYSLGKILLFIVLPVLTIFFLERWKIRKIFYELGIRRKKKNQSIFLGLVFGTVTIIITILVSATAFDPIFRTIMFFEAFTEEFFFRGFLFLYLLKKTDLKTAYLTSIIGFVLMHPQHFTSLFLISTIAQGILTTVIAANTRNITGCWIAHGLNRFVPSALRFFLGA